MKYKSIQFFHGTICKWKSGMGYYVMSVHDFESTIHKMVKHIQTARRLLAEELFECLTITLSQMVCSGNTQEVIQTKVEVGHRVWDS